MRKLVSLFQGLSITIGAFVVIAFLIPLLAGIKPYIVLSGSMEPEIKTGSVAYVDTHVDVYEIKVGDVIGFEFGKIQATHRVVEINEDNTFTTKGDANQNNDLAPVRFDQYKGKTIFSVPYLGRIISKVKTKTGKFVAALVIGLNIICIVFVSSDDDKKGKNKKEKNKNSKKDKDTKKVKKVEKTDNASKAENVAKTENLNNKENDQI